MMPPTCVTLTNMDVEPKIGVSQNGWFIMVPNLIKMDDLVVPLFLETPIWFDDV